jgi:hypothetical protein
MSTHPTISRTRSTKELGLRLLEVTENIRLREAVAEPTLPKDIHAQSHLWDEWRLLCCHHNRSLKKRPLIVN